MHPVLLPLQAVNKVLFSLMPADHRRSCLGRHALCISLGLLYNQSIDTIKLLSFNFAFFHLLQVISLLPYPGVGEILIILFFKVLSEELFEFSLV